MPYVATSMHHSVDHLITHGNVDQATTGWSTSVRTPASLQLIYGAGPSSVDTERCYGPGWLRNDDDDDEDDDDDGWIAAAGITPDKRSSCATIKVWRDTFLRTGLSSIHFLKTC